ncbi:hypothetical protein PQR64_35215 [Paraburkholderia phytofirmans]
MTALLDGTHPSPIDTVAMDIIRLLDEPAIGKIKNLRAEPFAQCGHLPQEEKPDRLNDLRVDFMHGWTDA